LSFCSGYLKVNLFIIRCFDPDSIALINPPAELAEDVPVLVVELVLLAGLVRDAIVCYRTRHNSTI
jgi:hypothetical protein